MLLMKFLGLLLILFVSSAIGFLKASAIKKRYSKLQQIIKSMNTLSEHLKIGNEERSVIIKKSFNNDFSETDENINTEFLKNSDIETLSEFFKGFGKRDKDSEIKRTVFYINSLNKNLEESKIDCDRLCKLYSEVGILFGIIICIFLV